MTLFVVITLAHQVEGEIILIKTEKAFTKAGKADELVKKLNNDFRDGDKFKTMKMTTEYGEIDCKCTAGAFDIELED
jgi:hypothetical protein